MHSFRTTPLPRGAIRVPSALLLALLFASCQDGPVAPRSSGVALAPPVALGESRADRAFEFTTIEYPGASATQASGINARGDIVGAYVAGGVQHGFVLRNGEFATIDYPGSVATDVRGIGPDGDIVGTYRMPGEAPGQVHGYVRRNDGEFIPVNSVSSPYTIAQRILPDGTILGCHHTQGVTVMEGIMVSREGYSELEVDQSMHNGATPDGRHIVGLYMNMDAGNRQEGYRIDDGVFTPLVAPNSNFTQAWDINPAGDIVGVYRSPDNKFHGFLLRDETYTTIDFPNASATRAFGINARGDVVGHYVLGGKTYGYVATR